jgi:hypothetical protein
MTTHASRNTLVRAALAALCLTLTPAIALAQVAPRSASGASKPIVGSLELGAGIGLGIPFESGIGAGFKLNFDGFYGVTQLAPGVVLQAGGNIGWTHNGGDFDASYNFFDFLPTARFRFAAGPQLFFYGDAGLGLAIVSVSVTSFGFSTSDSSAAFLVKLGGGLGYSVTPELSLTFEPAFNFYVKDGSITQFTMLAGVLYRL